jgi:PEP-CTERM motif
MTMIRLLAAGCAGAVMASAVASSAFAANNPPPPGAILDLAGTAIPHTPSQAYTVDFTASLANTAVSFAFRDDPAYLFFSDVSVTDLTTSSGNLLTNGDFSAGTYGASLPNGWTYQNTDGAAFQGRVTTSCRGPAYCWEDGSTQAYDLLSQTISTKVGDQYQISFDLWDNGPLSTFQQVSTNGDTTDTGGNGADVLAYATAAGSPNVPEPSTWAMMGLGFAGLAFVGHRARRSATAA